jgi:hypothetical protein
MFFENAVNIWKKIGAAVLGGDEIGMVGLLEVKFVGGNMFVVCSVCICMYLHKGKRICTRGCNADGWGLG